MEDGAETCRVMGARASTRGVAMDETEPALEEDETEDEEEEDAPVERLGACLCVLADRSAMTREAETTWPPPPPPPPPPVREAATPDADAAVPAAAMAAVAALGPVAVARGRRGDGRGEDVLEDAEASIARDDEDAEEERVGSVLGMSESP